MTKMSDTSENDIRKRPDGHLKDVKSKIPESKNRPAKSSQTETQEDGCDQDNLTNPKTLGSSHTKNLTTDSKEVDISQSIPISEGGKGQRGSMDKTNLTQNADAKIFDNQNNLHPRVDSKSQDHKSILKFPKFWKGKQSVDPVQSQKQEPNPKRSQKGLLSFVPQFQTVQQIDDLSTEDVIIAVMGPTGSGKSSFISQVTGKQDGIGHSLESCTAEISAVRLQSIERSDADIVFVDTPGFDDTNKSDTDILNMISGWLKKTYERKIMLNGILYFHRISDNRMAGTPLKNLRMFEELCGRDACQNIVLTTTMWDEVEDDVGGQRESELANVYWIGMIGKGSRTARYLNTTESAWNVLDPLLQKSNERLALLLQDEMVNLKMQLSETSAGQALYSRFEELITKQQETLRNIRAEIKKSKNDSEMLEFLRNELQAVRDQLDQTLVEMHSLKLTIGGKFIGWMKSKRLFETRRPSKGIFR